MKPEIYDEILKSDKRDLYANEYYSIPLAIEDVMYVLSLLKKDYNYKLYDEVRVYLNEEYDINIQC